MDVFGVKPASVSCCAVLHRAVAHDPTRRAPHQFPTQDIEMNHVEDDASMHLPVILSGAANSGATRSRDGLLEGTLTVACPVTGSLVLLQRCAFCAHSEGLFRDAIDGALTLRCRLPVES
jgi:hypothetical protein